MYNFNILDSFKASASKGKSQVTSMVHEISNGICRFSPTSTKGKWIFLFQTIILSFSPILLLIIQNTVSFSDMIKWKNEIINKDFLVTEATELSRFILDLQQERSVVCLAVFMSKRSSAKLTDLSKEYASTDRRLNMIKWRRFGPEKIFENKLRFQIRIDDFRERVSQVRQSSTLNTSMSNAQMSDAEILEFYNLATSRLLTALEVSSKQRCRVTRTVLLHY